MWTQILTAKLERKKGMLNKKCTKLGRCDLHRKEEKLMDPKEPSGPLRRPHPCVHPQGAPNGPIRSGWWLLNSSCVRIWCWQRRPITKKERLTCHKHGHVEFFPECLQLVFSILHFADKVTFTGCSFMLQTQKKKRGRARNGCVKIGVDGYWVMPAVLYNNTIPALPHCTPSPA